MEKSRKKVNQKLGHTLIHAHPVSTLNLFLLLATPKICHAQRILHACMQRHPDNTSGLHKQLNKWHHRIDAEHHNNTRGLYKLLLKWHSLEED